MRDMVTNEVVAAITAPTIGESMCNRPKRTRLSRLAKRKADVSGNKRSLVGQVLVAPFHERAIIPQRWKMCREDWLWWVVLGEIKWRSRWRRAAWYWSNTK